MTKRFIFSKNKGKKDEEELGEIRMERKSREELDAEKERRDEIQEAIDSRDDDGNRRTMDRWTFAKYKRKRDAYIRQRVQKARCPKCNVKLKFETLMQGKLFYECRICKKPYTLSFHRARCRVRGIIYPEDCLVCRTHSAWPDTDQKCLRWMGMQVVEFDGS